MDCDYVLKGRKIYTLDDGKPQADWVAVKGEKIAFVGSGDVPAHCKILDLKDSVILPGLIDSHVHGGTTAVMCSGVNLVDAVEVSDILNRIEQRCAATEDDLVIASFFVMPQVKEGRYPTRQELDRVSHGKKVMVVSITLHGSSINTAAFESVGFPDGIAGMTYDEGGVFTGLLADDDAHFFALGKLLSDLPETRYEKYIDDFGRMCAQVGLTTAHCMEGQFVKGDKDIDLWLKKIADGSLPFHCVLYPQTWDYEKALAYGLPRHGGCLTLDGADMDFTMALDEPYTCKPAVRGNLYRSDLEVYTLAAKASRDSKQIAFHAMGERAIDQALDAYRRVIAEQGDKKLRFRIEHFTLPRFSHIELAARLGVVVGQQPEYSWLFDTPGGPVEEWFGAERVHSRFEHYRSVQDAGVVVAGGSDSPVNSLNPLTGIHGLVNARFDTRRFSVTGALKVYTQQAAYAAFEENERGTIKKGYFADFTALSEDPYEKPDVINEIEVTHTISQGRQVYEK
ncbi:MAG: amidohydrolase family protein [Oscillospiraceae bacterium]|nr:amidohydrolase family protein [Oscillospiraceae bacterium]